MELNLERQKLSTLAIFGLLLLIYTFSPLAQALNYTDKSLVMYDIEDMNKKIHEIRRQKLDIDDPDEARTVKLQEAVQFLFARKDTDGTRSKIYIKLASELQDSEATVLNAIADKALKALSSENTPVQDQSTYVQILENLQAEIQPRKQTFAHLFEKIRDQKIEISEDLKKHRMVKGITTPKSPSKTAEMIIGAKVE